MGISDPKVIFSMGIFLIVATVSIFAFAFWRVRAELKLLRSEQNETREGDEENAQTESDTGTVLNPEQQPAEPPTEAKRGGSSPQDSLVTTVSEEQRQTSTKPKSQWGLFGLCAAESEIQLEDSPEDTHGGSGGTAALLARLAEKDDALRKKDEEIVRLAASAH